jgi:pilus assembly protein FimV
VVNIWKESNVRNLTKAFTAISLLAPVTGYSLGVGSIKLHSSLNQKLKAEIALVVSASAGENIDDIKVRLAPPEKFDAAGVKWSYFLSKIKFETKKKSNGAVVIQLTSSEALKEPFLDFLIEVNWSAGSLYREFTVLVDPPTTYAQSANDVQVSQPDLAARSHQPAKIATTTASSSNIIVEDLSKTPEQKDGSQQFDKDGAIKDKDGAIKKVRVVAKPKKIKKYNPKKVKKYKSKRTKTAQKYKSRKTRKYNPKVVKPYRAKNGSQYGPTERNTSLSAIAAKTNRYRGVSAEQMMLAIYEANPHAFYQKNVNALSAGKILTIPSKEAILRISRHQAVAEFKRQNNQWKGIVSSETKKPAPVRKKSGSHLVLKAPDEAKISNTTQAATSLELDKEAKKFADSKQDSKIQLEKLQEQLKNIKQMLVLKDKQLALWKKRLSSKSSKATKKTVEEQHIEEELAKLSSVGKQTKLDQEKLAKAKADEEKAAQIKADQEKIAKAKADEEKAAQIKADQEKIAKAKADEEKAAQVKADQEKIAKAKADEEKIEQVTSDQSTTEENGAGNEVELDVETAKNKLLELEATVEANKSADAEAVLVADAKAEEKTNKLNELEIKEPKSKAEKDEIELLKAEIKADEEIQEQLAFDVGVRSEANIKEIERLKEIISSSERITESPQKVDEPEIPEEESIFDDPYYLSVAGGSALFLILLGWVLFRKRKLQDSTEVESMFTESSEINLPDDNDDDEFGVENLDENSLFMFGGESSFLSDDNDFDAFEVDQDEVDPISEADVYLAYDRYQQAEELMRQAIEDQPNRDECKFKLLEILAANDDKEGFEKYVQELADSGKNADNTFWIKVVEMGQEIIPDSPLLTLTKEDPSHLDGNKAEDVVSDEANNEEADDSEINMPLDELDDKSEVTKDTNNLDVSLFDSEDEIEAEDSPVELQSSDDDDLSLFDNDSLDDSSVSLEKEDGFNEVPESLDNNVDLSSFNDEITEPAPADEAIENDVDFDLSGFNDEVTKPAPADEPIENDVNFDLSEFNDEVTEPAPADEPIENDVDFDLSGFEEDSENNLDSFSADAEEDIDLSGFDTDEDTSTTDDFDLSAFGEENSENNLDSFSADAEEDIDLSGFDTDEDTSTTDDFDLSAFGEEDSENNLDSFNFDTEEEVDLSGFEVVEDENITDEFDLSTIDNENTEPLGLNNAISLEDDTDNSMESDNFESLSEMSVEETKIDLARAYIDMGDLNAAKIIIEEVLAEGTDEQKIMAQELMSQL